ncbi:MAG: glutamate--cysteine ligase [Proteobacteria bacterium]|nr:glutamate--cysteine ligase [Pseudomonadota bacterium]
MSGPQTGNTGLIQSRDDLVQYLAAGCKPQSSWRIGTEHEKIVYRKSDLGSPPYEGPDGIGAVLAALTRYGWRPVTENGTTIALSKDDGSGISLEPAGQLELSGAPVENIHQTCSELSAHLQQAKTVGDELGLAFLGIGHQPKWPAESLPWMPKGRYAIMRRYMQLKGKLGLSMMQATCTVQVNLDFDSEAAMVQMFRIGMALQSVATALWANSPFNVGRPTGYLSYRSHIWTDTDPDRSGILPFVFEDGFGFERYVDYALDVPMYFVYRDGKYIDVAGQSFRDFLAGKLPGYPGHKPIMSDWADHLTTAFPEVRLKQFLEMRGADGGPWNRLCALPAFWVGLLYDAPARAAAWDLVKDWTAAEVIELRNAVPRLALNAPFRNGTVLDIARQAVAIARDGLKGRARLNASQSDETCYIDPLDQTVQSGRTPAEEMLEQYNTVWQRSVDPVFRAYAY